MLIVVCTAETMAHVRNRCRSTSTTIDDVDAASLQPSCNECCATHALDVVRMASWLTRSPCQSDGADNRACIAPLVASQISTTSWGARVTN